MSSQINENDLKFITDTSDSDSNDKEGSGIPDGGWGWVVLVACVIIRIIISGTVASFGLFIHAFQVEYNVSPTTVSWMASLLSASYLIISPAVGISASKFGYRPVAIVGAITAGLIFATPFFYSPFWFLFVSAIVTGLSMGFTFTCATLILTTYFEKYLSTVMGIFSASTGAASFIMVPFGDFLITRYKWRVAVLAYGGLLWFAALLCLTFRKVQLKQIATKNDGPSELEDINQNTQCEKTTSMQCDFFGSKKSMAFKLFDVVNETNNQTEQNYLTSMKNMSSIPDMSIPALLSMSIASNLQRRATVNKESEIDVENAHIEENRTPTKTIGYLALLTNPIILVFLLSNFLSQAGYDTTFIYGKQRAMEAGISADKATLLLSTVGIGSFVGRLLFGYLGSIKRLDKVQMFIWCLMLGGASILYSKFAITYVMMFFYTIGFGLFIGGAQPLTSMVLLEILDLNNFRRGLALVFVAQACGLLLCSPISGFIYDMTKSFDWSFMVSGCVMLSSGAVLYLMFLSKSFRKSRNSAN